MSLKATVRMIRETRGMTQQQLATAAGVSLSTVRRLEREETARFHPETERQLEFALKLKEGAFEHLREGGSVDAAFETGLVLWLGASPYGDAPLADIVVSDSHVARVMARSLDVMGTRAAEELSLAAVGKLFPDFERTHQDFLSDWLPWSVRLVVTPLWLHRLHDSATQVQTVLAKGLVPKPLRMAEAVLINIAFERAWAIDTNAFFREGQKVADPVDDRWDDVYGECDPRPLFDRARIHREWIDAGSPMHPARWWVRQSALTLAG